MEENDIGIMIDIETLGKGQDPIVIQIGACSFNLGGVIDSYCEGIELSNAILYGKLTASTQQWWREQPRELFGFVTSGTTLLQKALEGLSEFIQCNRSKNFGKLYVWTNHPAFDQSALECKFDYFSMPYPWKHYETFDYATIMRVAIPENAKKAIEKDNAYTQQHDALDDAKTQALRLIYALEHLRNGQH